jgi:hypothetical protein
MARDAIYVSFPGIGDYERVTVLAPWGGEEFVRYLPVSAAAQRQQVRVGSPTAPAFRSR